MCKQWSDFVLGSAGPQLPASSSPPGQESRESSREGKGFGKSEQCCLRLCIEGIM